MNVCEHIWTQTKRQILLSGFLFRQEWFHLFQAAWNGWSVKKVPACMVRWKTWIPDAIEHQGQKAVLRFQSLRPYRRKCARRHEHFSQADAQTGDGSCWCTACLRSARVDGCLLWWRSDATYHFDSAKSAYEGRDLRADRTDPGRLFRHRPHWVPAYRGRCRWPEDVALRFLP